MVRTPERYTHGHHASVLRSHRWRTAANSAGYLLDELRPGMRVLDVGCGPATITVDLAARVAPGLVVGVDRVEGVLTSARAELSDGGPSVALLSGDAYHLPFADATFDVVHAHQVLQHLGDPVGALREWRRVCRPGGVVAARDSDYAAFTWYPDDPVLTRWLELYHALASRNGGEADAGRRLVAWAHAAGFADVRASASAWCFSTPEDREWWGGSWAERATESAFATQAVEAGLSSVDELAAIAAAWRRWAASPDAWFAILHGEILARP